MNKSEIKPGVVLGKEVFVLSPTADIVRTTVSAICKTHYTFLNGGDSSDRHWMVYAQAAGAAVEVLENHKAKLRKELRQLGIKSLLLQTESYKQNVLSSPYHMAGYYRGDTKIRPCTRKNAPAAPKTHLMPGTLVYAGITPLTPPCNSEHVYRPYRLYVLEIEVEDVSLSRDGTVHYRFSTPLQFDEHFFSRHDAEKHLQSMSMPGLKNIAFVTHAEEKKALEDLEDDDIPF